MVSKCPRCACEIPANRSFCPGCQLVVFRDHSALGRGQSEPSEVVIGAARVSTDGSVARTVDAIPLLPQLVEGLLKYWSKPMQRAQHLGCGVRTGPNQLPRLHAIVRQHANALDLTCPELFVKQDPTLNAYTFGTNDDACVVVHSALVDLLDQQELNFILAHEIGHIKARHVTYGSVLSMVAQGLLGPLATFSALLAPLDAWSREAEQTADQIGIILADQDASAIRALMLLAVGSRSLLVDINLAPYLEQQEDLCDFYGKWNLYFGGQSHPYIVTRVVNLLRFTNSEPARQARAALGRSVAWPTPQRGFTAALPRPSSPVRQVKFCPDCGFEFQDNGALACKICGARKALNFVNVRQFDPRQR